MNKLQERKQNNKGFSLVELIIVIAIMAVLVAILAPAFMRYVEESRQKADISAVDSVVQSVKAAYTNSEFKLDNGAKATVELSDDKADFSATVSAPTGETANLETALKNSDVWEATLKSTKWGKVTLEFTEDGGVLKLKITDDASATVKMSEKYNDGKNAS